MFCFLCVLFHAQAKVPWHHHARCGKNSKKEMQQYKLCQASRWKEVLNVVFLFLSSYFYKQMHTFSFTSFGKEGLDIGETVMFTFLHANVHFFLSFFQQRKTWFHRGSLFLKCKSLMIQAGICKYTVWYVLKYQTCCQTCCQHSVLWFCK